MTWILHVGFALHDVSATIRFKDFSSSVSAAATVAVPVVMAVVVVEQAVQVDKSGYG